MGLFTKRTSPVDRALRQLERELAEVNEKARELEEAKDDLPLHAPTARGDQRRPTPSMNSFVSQMLGTTPRESQPSYRTSVEFFDGANGADALDSDAATLARQPDPDLFAHAAQTKQAAARPEGKSEEDPRLARYLGAGTFRNQRPLRYVERRARNRFMMWLGLSFTALWLVYLVIK